MNELQRRETVDDIVNHYKRIVRETKAGYKLLARANTTLRESINQYGRVSPKGVYTDFDERTLESVLHEVKCHTWKGIIDRIGIRNVMDSSKRKEIDNQLETGEGLPEVETEAIMKVIMSIVGNAESYMTASIKEAFEIIRRKSEGFKSTGQEWSVTDKAVLTYMIEKSYGRNSRYHVCYGRSSEDALLSVESAFRMLDGKGPCKGHSSELAGSINSSLSGDGETEYFRWKAFKNGNLHLWFKRMDLVEEMNAVAGGKKVLRKAG